MPVVPALRQPSRTLVIAAAAVPLALAVLADDVRVRRRLQTARRDPLTGLADRAALMDHTTRLSATHREQLHVLVADADGLKTVNDSLGHAAGDLLIAAIGRRFGAWAEARGGLAARLGGDEFGAAVLLPATATVREVTALRDQLAQPIPCGTELLRPAVSIGTARAADLPDAADASRILRGADMAMYRVKNGQARCGYVATRHDAYTPAVHGRRPGRPGTHLPVG
ncbi:GGDEF domain-containing protein [Streptomyces sp. NBC_00474]|uniref:GGDEF domain-containing protein n=1 Tax=Streptomyces sp. NBC_00474 TaxID=2975754 RepID=UPI0022575AA3|nr:GGDEF domain-containing protein [Streptomyces sp. NBC_00474]MCX5055079.1 GGDEF domain-containing protein [Streptomyces sp. NBC_00474]